MPRSADHHARRNQLAAALMRLAASEGLEAVSLRHVAAEAGVSTGMVQHYFRTKDQMMTFALEAVSATIQARATADAARLGPHAPPGALVRALLNQILPLDETRRLEGHVMLAFLAYSTVRPTVAATLRDGSAQLREFIAHQISRAQATNDPPLRVDPTHGATALLALVDGLGIHILGRHYPVETALAALEAHLTALFGPEESAHR